MRRAIFISLLLLPASAAIAQPPAANPDASCPPGVGANAPTVGKESDKPLSDQLAQSKGIICPPAGIDPEIRRPPPEGGAIRIIPPPGSPGGNPSVQPK
jgi:hypothetical protein